MFLSRALAGLCCLALGACTDGQQESTMPLRRPEASYSVDGDVEYQRGTLPIIVTAPHGGHLRPDEIADRTDGDLLNDAKTQELARLVATALGEGDAQPHLVINHLHRSKLDANRPLEAATAGDPRADAAWDAYHAIIEQARADVVANHGRGLLIDIHGHSHDVDWVELGYLLTGMELSLDDAALEGLAAESSITNLVAASPRPFSELIRGESSLGAYLEEAGFTAVPSPAHPAPNGRPYYNGGYTIQRHGPSDGAPIDAVQIEAYKKGLRDSKVSRIAFASILGAAVRRTFGLSPAP